MPAVTDIDEIDAITEYLDRVYSPIAIDEGDKIKWSARAMRTEMEDRIRAAVSQLEEIGRPHNAAVQEVVAKLKDPDAARREVVQAARIAINRSIYVQEREKTPWWRRDSEGWCFAGIMLFSFGVRGLVPQSVNEDPAFNISFAVLLFVVGFGCVMWFLRMRKPTQSVLYYFSAFTFYLVWGAIYAVHSNPVVRGVVAGPMCALSGIHLGSGIIALRYEKSKRGLDTSLWNRKA